ncbi:MULTISPECIES: MarR family winged helix-turn-helix transcriptional regulator [Streptomyces]|uniref:MarR family transcriptional regulator n=1 Tax=Streptomyces himastatinicus ATCC 53653 TaxID=457427 RepID=D9WN75_9ACTN|nr:MULTISPECIES: MarR family transcriptional regulator [Streptomyces]EFL23772.1 MarR family transcriptional regulator [Streptomyces himastatinicus ATCC 53653]
MNSPADAAADAAADRDAGSDTAADEPRWLDDDEQRTWLAYIQASMLLEDHLDRQLQRDARMPHVYYGLLVKLSWAPRHRMRMTELAEAAKITRSRLSHAITRMEKDGWVRREDCPDDKRGQNAVLTEKGFDVLKQTAPGHVDAVRSAIFDRLTSEQIAQFGDVCRIIADGLQPEGADLPWLR